MRQKTFTLPSGVKIEMRNAGIAEENLMAGLAKGSGSIERGLMDVLDRCTLGVADVGPYDFLTVGGKANWRQMIRGDMFTALVQLRTITYRDGHMLEFEQRCPAVGCRHRFAAEVNLLDDLIWQDMPQDSIDKLKRGELFEAEIDGRLVKYTLAFGRTEENYMLLAEQNPGRDMACGLRSRIAEVDGLEPHQILDWLDGNNGKSDKFPGLGSQEAEDLRDAFDVVEGGIDTSVEVYCPRCSEVFDVNVPFSAFFLPGKGINTRRREARKKKKMRGSEQSLGS